ncbi:MAG: tetratricopeptide repeat protein, partial [Candidatus Hermodarchaeota archaeon]
MSVPEEIYRAYSLLNEGREEEAWQLIKNREKIEHLKPEQKHLYRMFKGSVLFLTGRLQESLKLGEKLYQENKSQKNTLNAIDALLLKSFNLFMLGRIAEMGENAMLCETMLKSVLQEPKSEIEWREAMISHLNGYYLHNIGEIDKALKELKKCLKFVEKYDTLSVMLPILLSALGWVYTGKGELDLALKFHKKSLDHSKGNYMAIKLINATSYHDIGEIYFQNGALDQAVDYYEKSLKIWKQFNSPMAIGWVSIDYNSLIKVFLYRDSSDRAQEYLDNFLDYLQIRKIDENFYWYKLGKARILTSSSRTRDRAEAERIIKEFIAEHDALVKSGTIIVLGPI